jgi:hypothetical protein
MTFHRRTLAALGLALLLTGSAALAAPKPAAPAKTYPTGLFTVAGKPVSAKDVLDARTIPDMQGKPSLMVTLTPAMAATLAKAGTPRVACTLDGKPIGDSPTDALAMDHVLQLSGDFGDYNAAAALARRISGRDPLPDAESDE